MRTPWPFGAALAVAAGLGWMLCSSASARTGVLACAVASAVVLGFKTLAVRSNLQRALGISAAGLVLRVAAWAVGYGWIRARGGDAGSYTLGYFGLFVVALCLEVTYVLVAAGVQRRGRGEV